MRKEKHGLRKWNEQKVGSQHRCRRIEFHMARRVAKWLEEEYYSSVIESTALSEESQFPAFVASHSESNLLLVNRSRDKTDEIEEAIALLSKNSPSGVSLILQG